MIVQNTTMLIFLLWLSSLLVIASAWDTENCGRRTFTENYIVGGEDAVHGQLPWQALIYQYASFKCGATLINPEWAITAAHCMVSLDISIVSVSVGIWNKFEKTEGTEQNFKAAEIIIHPMYNAFAKRSDVALIKLAGAVVYNDYVVPACPPTDKTYTGEMATVSGWGTTKYGLPLNSHILQYVELPVISNEECRKSYPSGIYSNSLCAGMINSGEDACSGDSGGPLVAQNSEGRFELIGIVSWGEECGILPGVYVRVSEELDWIESTIAYYSD